MTVRRLVPILAPTAGTLAVAAALFAVSPYAFLVMAPALALAWLVAVGLFTGERAIRWTRRALRPARPRAARTVGAARSVRPKTSRGGLLLAASLASRPPPTRAAARLAA